MNNKIFKYIKYLSYVLLLLGVGVFVYFVVASVLYPEPATEFPVGTVGNAMGVNVMLIYAYVVFAVALVLAIMFPLINIISNPKGAMRTLIGVVAMLVIFFVSYLLSSDAPVPNPAANGYFTNSAVLKADRCRPVCGLRYFCHCNSGHPLGRDKECGKERLI